jgi:hypothetical protein
MKLHIFIITFLFAANAFASIQFLPSSINLPRVDIDRPIPSSANTRLYNNTREDLSINVSAFCGIDFSVSNFCSYVPAGSSCSVSVRFRPMSEGYKSCQIRASSSNGRYSSNLSVYGQAYSSRWP